MSGKSIGEALAALGVIGSMVFVGLEIRQSNVQARAAAYQAIGIAAAEAIDNWAHDPALSQASLKPVAEMTSTDWQRYYLKFGVFARLGEMVLLQVEEGILPPDAMERFGFVGWKRIYEDPKVGCIWPLIQREVGRSFVAFVEEGQDPSGLDCSSYPIPGGGVSRELDSQPGGG